MNKTEFLDELKNCLAVLEEKEQRDILEEYTQHIDIKMERGLSEEEAIGDFGDLGQLAAEILEAYHVNPDYNGNRTLSPVLRVRDLIRRARSGFLGIARAAALEGAALDDAVVVERDVDAAGAGAPRLVRNLHGFQPPLYGWNGVHWPCAPSTRSTVARSMRAQRPNALSARPPPLPPSSARTARSAWPAWTRAPGPAPSATA